MVEVPEPVRSVGPRPARRSPLEGGHRGFCSRFRRVLVERRRAETYVATRFSPIPNNTAAATSDSRARIKSRRTHPRLVRDPNCRQDPRARGRERARIPRGGWKLALTCMAPSTRRTDDPPTLQPTRTARNPPYPQSYHCRASTCPRYQAAYGAAALDIVRNYQSIVRYMVTDP